MTGYYHLQGMRGKSGCWLERRLPKQGCLPQWPTVACGQAADPPSSVPRPASRSPSPLRVAAPSRPPSFLTGASNTRTAPATSHTAPLCPPVVQGLFGPERSRAYVHLAELHLALKAKTFTKSFLTTYLWLSLSPWSFACA